VERLNGLLLKKARELPMLPGVYLMRDGARNIVYIGKAKILKNRVPSYFVSSSKHSDKILRMLEIVTDFDFIVTKSEYEALVLECSLIKRHQPKYNTMLKDDKGYSYIAIGRSKDEWNKIQPVKKKQNDNNSYIGPFVSSAVAVTLCDQINQIFKLPCCARKLLKKSFTRPCLNYYINRCGAPCARKVEEEEYEKTLKKATQVLDGNKKRVLKELRNEMVKFADELEFEKAAKIRDVIKAIQKLKGNQHVVLKQKVTCDVFGFVFSPQNFFGTVLSFADGVLAESKGLRSVGESVDKSISQLLVQYYTSRESVPEYVVIERDELDLALVAKFLKKRDEKFKGIVLVEEEIVLSIQAGEEVLKKPVTTHKHAWQAIHAMAKNNAAQQALLDEKADCTKTLLSLMQLLKLKNIPELIEVYDISNIADTAIVGSMVTFRHGEAQKSGYRRFKIKSLVAQDDYGSMREVIFRRFKNYIKQNSDEGTGANFKERPDLVLIDGGKQHVSVVKNVLDDLGLDIDVAGLTKNEKHRTKSIVFGKQEISLKGELLNMVTRMQDEAHRFAITYARHVHKNIAFDGV
jgi:excinuclease ABC subunit C